MAAVKLTLGIEEKLVNQAKSYAQAHQTSISALFSMFISSLQHEAQKPPLPPLARKALGLAKPKHKLPKEWNYKEELANILLDREPLA